MRDGRLGDADRLFEIFRAAVHVGAAGAYSPAQRAVWCPKSRPDEGWRKAVASWRVRVAEIGDAPVGFCAMRGPRTLHMLFVLPEQARCGIGAALVKDAVDRAGAQSLETIASHCSETVFARAGWSVESRWVTMPGGVLFVKTKMVSPDPERHDQGA